MERTDGDEGVLGTRPELNTQAMDKWDRVIGDMEATAEDFDESGWTTLQLHPGDVTIAENADPPGIDVILPNPEFEQFQEYVESGVRFDEYEVFRSDGEAIELALLVAKGSEQETAVFLPLYYRLDDLAELVDPGTPGSLPLYLRQLDDETVLLELTEPNVLLSETL